MIEHRPFASLGAFRNEWLESRHHFSFSDYHDPRRMSWGALRVWNDDRIKPASGFPMHGHRDMEIITYVRQGAVTHQDNLGNRGATPAGSVQVMHAGAGIVHGEFNEQPGDTSLFQIWIIPARQAVTPGWQMREFPRGAAAGKLVALASGRAGDDGALPLHQDAAMLCATLAKGETASHGLAQGRHAYLVPARGAVTVNGVRVDARDGCAIADEANLTIKALDDAELILADVP